VTEPTHLAALYNAAELIVWVEDLVTAAYVSAIWGHDRRFKLYVGGGHENLAAVVEDAQRSGRRGVFSLRDRDFGPTNRGRWTSPDVVHFALEAFEIECFLLEPEALAASSINTAGRTAAEFQARLSDMAAELVWWMACRRVLAELREARQEQFPRHPKRREVPTREAAEAVLLNNPWVQVTAPGLGARVEAERLRSSLEAAHEEYSRHLAAGTWIPVFSGKELLEELLSWFYTRNRPPGSAALQDVAKAVAAVQTKAGRAPAELIELRDALLARAAEFKASKA
jgi:hypothetical protein